MLLDTSGILAALDEGQTHHRECLATLLEAAPPLLLSPFILAELDYLIGRYVGPQAQISLLEEVSRGTYQLELFAAADVARAVDVMQLYSDLNIGLADASIVVLAQRHATADVLTLDRRHFSALRIDRRKRFRLHPLDS